MTDIWSAHSSATALATNAVKLVMDQGLELQLFKTDMETLTTEIHQFKTRWDAQPNIDEARIAQTVQQYLQRGPIAPSGFSEDNFRAHVISIIHEQYPQITVNRIHEIFEHENDVRIAIEQRLYKDFITMLCADGSGPTPTIDQATNNTSSPPNNHQHPNNGTQVANGSGDTTRQDEDEPAGYAAYFHYEYQRKRIANLAKEHWTCREHGYLHVRDFEDANEALHWMNDEEDVPELPHTLQHPPPNSTFSPNYNSESSRTSGERYRRDRFLDEHEHDAQSDHSVEGYFGYNDRGQTGAPYYVNGQGEKILIRDQPFNMAMAGRSAPTEEECNRMRDEFARQDHYDHYGPSPNSSPYHHAHVQGNIQQARSPTGEPRAYNSHRRGGSYQPSSHPRGAHAGDNMNNTPPRHHQQSPYRHTPSPYHQSQFEGQSNIDNAYQPPQNAYIQDIDTERKMSYLGVYEGWPVLQVSDFVRLGFLNPEQSSQVLSPIHSRIMTNWEIVSRYGTATRGPNVLLLSSSTSFTPLDSQKPNETIYWYNNLGQLLEPFNIAMTPFEHIEIRFGTCALCPPGMGIQKFDEMGRALSLLLTTKLLPMQANTDNSELANALTIATEARKPNGYELLHVTLRKLVPAFDERKVNIKWPLYGSYDSIFRYASAFEQTVMLAAKRGQRFLQKNAAIQFLDGIIAEAGQAYIIQARILRTDVNALTDYGPVPPRFDLKKMAVEIQETILQERADPDLQRKASINKSIATMTIEDRPNQLDQASHSASFAPSVLTLESKTTMQGSSELIYRVNRAAYRPQPDRNHPARYPVPDPAKDLTKKRQSLYDPSITCDACRQRGHPAARCHTLAASLFLREYIAKESNESTMQRAMENWVKRNAPIIKDAKTQESLKKNPLQVLYTYMDRTGFSMDKILNELEWEFFDQGSKVDEAFGVMGGHSNTPGDAAEDSE
jgi:hypothetical protein